MEQNIIKIIKECKIFISIIIFSVSILFAYIILFATILSINYSFDGFMFIILGMPLVLLNFLLYKRFPERFASWNHNFKSKMKHDYAGMISLPPFSIIAMSTALIVFLFHFFNQFANMIWMSSLDRLPLLMESVGMYFIKILFFIIFFVVIPIFIFMACMYLSNKIFPKLKSFLKNKKFKILFLILTLIYFLVVIYFLYDFQKNGRLENIPELVKMIMSIIIGFIPIHWFYELFIASFLSRIKLITLSQVIFDITGVKYKEPKNQDIRYR